MDCKIIVAMHKSCEVPVDPCTFLFRWEPLARMR